jgi:hypothetical protein
MQSEQTLTLHEIPIMDRHYSLVADPVAAIAEDRSANPFRAIHGVQYCEYGVRERQRVRIFVRYL